MIKFVCPLCFKSLEKNKCSKCNYEMKVDSNGVVHAHRNDATWEKCLGQVEAVRKAEQSCQSYQNRFETKSEERNRSKEMNEKMISKVIEIIQPTGKTFLEIGGASGWASARFLDEGAKEGTLLDIDEKLLGTGIPNLTSVIGDGYYLPYLEEQFDFVFDCSALHHFEYLYEVLGQVNRVLKLGGTYISQGNPPRVGKNDDDKVRYMKDFGLIETMPTLDEYRDAFTTVFRSFNIINVEDNTIMYVTKEEDE